MAFWTSKQKREHYTAVANGSKPVKADSKYSEAEQRAYARGQRDALNDQAVGHMLGKNSRLTAEEKQAFKERRKAKRKAWLESRKTEPKKPAGKSKSKK